jgi:hypothetical protein
VSGRAAPPRVPETRVARDDQQAKTVHAAPGGTRLEPEPKGRARISSSRLHFCKWAPRVVSMNIKSNIARNFLGTFRRERSVFVPKFPVLFALSFGGRRAKCPDRFEKSGAGDRDRTDDIQLGKLSFYH